MNCKQIEELLPLYAGHDLSQRREQLVTAHLQSCTACSLAAAGYHDARELMRDFAPPVFGDEVYAEIRKNVWQRIERKPPPPSIFESIAVWFQPRFVWTASVAALLITISAGGLYFIVKESTVRPANVVSIPKPVTPDAGPPRETRGGVPLTPGEGSPKQRQANMPKRQPDRIATHDRGNALVAYSPDAQTTVQKKTGAQPSRLPIRASKTLALQSADDLDLAPRGSEKALRMEIQTRNPNIRIIWFAQPN
ncbi:MAG TPA: zf-HC2 domain-containing protein [Pyrinomonadaceae bacterium]|jgi:hypothetical protein|nr:zf-HC2 domain-containing protein [Pyrinomonadaceae bacterium]